MVSKYAKAIAPAALTLFAVLVHWAVSGELDRQELELAIVGVAAAAVTWRVPNAEGPAVHVHEGEPPEGDTTTLGTPVS